MAGAMQLLPVILLALGCAAQCCVRAQAPSEPGPDSGSRQPALGFSAGSGGEFTFDTGVLRGKLRAEGRSRGLSSVVYLHTGTRLDSSMGLFSHYRVFTAGKRYGTGAWEWPSEARLAPDGAVEVRWPAANGRPFELEARYRWVAANVLDLETTVVAKTNLLRFESFLASYFTAEFTNCFVCVAGPGGAPHLLAADKSYGPWLAFPRDDAAAAVIRDGRWKFEPNPVDWILMPRLARPVAVRRAPSAGIVVVLTSPAKDCLAVSTPEQTNPHDSLYLSLFGQDLKEGETARARARLLIGRDLPEAEILNLGWLAGK